MRHHDDAEAEGRKLRVLQAESEGQMRATTILRHKLIREAYKALPPMPAMKAYTRLGLQFGLSDETIRQILQKNHPPN